MLINGHPVCDDHWSDTNARVVCRMLGFSGGRAVTHSHFGNVGNMFIMDDVICSEDDTSILDCEFAKDHNCRASEAAGVICIGETEGN